MVICGAPQIANKPGTDLDVITTFVDKVGSTLGIPEARISGVLDCEGTPDRARIVTTDWLTAHPQAKNIIAMSWSDTVTVAMTQSLEQKGYTHENAVSAGGQANDPALSVMSRPNSIFQANFDKDFPTWGIIGLSMARTWPPAGRFRSTSTREWWRSSGRTPRPSCSQPGSGREASAVRRASVRPRTRRAGGRAGTEACDRPVTATGARALTGRPDPERGRSARVRPSRLPIRYRLRSGLRPRRGRAPTK